MSSNLTERIAIILAPAISAAMALVLEEQRSSKAASDLREQRDKPSDQVEKFMTVPEVATLLRVHRRTIYDFVYQNKMPYHKVGDRILFLRSELVEWTAKQGEVDRSRRTRIVKS